jgi:Chaperone of endosialidase
MQKITAAEKQKEIEALAANLKGRTMNPLTQSKNATILPVLIALTLACFGLSPQARATCQEGCLPNSNTAFGDNALINNTGSFNTAIGFQALTTNLSGSYNTASGAYTLSANTLGYDNIAIGPYALSSNTTGSDNIAQGENALLNNVSGAENIAIGINALDENETGYSNTAVGFAALFYTKGNNNIAIGDLAGSDSTGSDNIFIGNVGKQGDSQHIRIGTSRTQLKTFVAGIWRATVPTGVGVIVDSNGQLGTVVSSERFKSEIKPMDKASEAILSLRPVTFRYKRELDPKATPQFGLVAEQVEKVNPDLVARDDQGKAYTVRYEAVNAMLLNEFLKAHRNDEQQDRKIEKLEATIAQLQASLKAQAVQIQQVSDQIRAQSLAPRVVANN